MAYYDPQLCQVLGLSANAGLEGLGLGMTREQMGSAPVQKTPLAPGQSTTFACNYGDSIYIKIMDKTQNIEVKFKLYKYGSIVPVTDNHLAMARGQTVGGGGQQQTSPQFMLLDQDIARRVQERERDMERRHQQRQEQKTQERHQVQEQQTQQMQQKMQDMRLAQEQDNAWRAQEREREMERRKMPPMQQFQQHIQPQQYRPVSQQQYGQQQAMHGGLGKGGGLPDRQYTVTNVVIYSMNTLN